MNDYLNLNPFSILTSPFAAIPWVLGYSIVSQLALGWCSTPAEVLIRHSFGERYLTPQRVLMSLYSFQIFGYSYNIIGSVLGFASPANLFNDNFDLQTLFANGTHSFLFKLFIWAYVLRCAWHLLEIWRRNLAGVEWHSNSFGISYLEELLPWDLWQTLVSYIPYSIVRQALEPTDWKIYCILEPLVGFIAAQVLWRVDGLLGLWMVLSSVSLAAKNMLHYMEFRSRFLNLSDSRIEGQYMQQALQGVNKRETAGFSVVSVPIRNLKSEI